MKASDRKLFETNLTRYSQTYPYITIIGSGGNIIKLNKLCQHSKGNKEITVKEVQILHDKLKSMTIEERIENFDLKNDRADVIVPAAGIFLKAAEYLKAESIIVPNISLADSIVDGLYKHLTNS